MEKCLFCEIINKNIPAEIIYEDSEIIVFKDINPSAPVHLLIVPKKHIESVQNLKTEDKELIAKIFFKAQDLAKEYKMVRSGYRIITNTGHDAGQMVKHLHFHLLGGKELKGIG